MAYFFILAPWHSTLGGRPFHRKTIVRMCNITVKIIEPVEYPLFLGTHLVLDINIHHIHQVRTADNGQQDGAVIFASDLQIRTLGACSVLYCDGTFKSCPLPFKQMYVVHGLFHGRRIPLGFVLLKKKTQGTNK